MQHGEIKRWKDGKIRKHIEDTVRIPNICLISCRRRGEGRTEQILLDIM